MHIAAFSSFVWILSFLSLRISFFSITTLQWLCYLQQGHDYGEKDHKMHDDASLVDDGWVGYDGQHDMYDISLKSYGWAWLVCTNLQLKCLRDKNYCLMNAGSKYSQENMAAMWIGACHIQ